MEDISRIIESLDVQFYKAAALTIKDPFSIENFNEIESAFIFMQKGDLFFGKKKEKVGEILFIPGGKTTPLSFLNDYGNKIPNNAFQENKEKYLAFLEHVNDREYTNKLFWVSIDAKVFNAVTLFTSLDILPFEIQNNPIIKALIIDIVEESLQNKTGKYSILACKSKELIIELLRHIIQKSLFVEQITINSNNLRDTRLIKLFSFINKNLGKDLSNGQLSKIADVSHDYVGQYFKTLTGINPQDYIEAQRMQQAITLLRGSSKSIREIGKEIGYKDSSYFCRRFKMMFGTSAGRMRRRESVKNFAT